MTELTFEQIKELVGLFVSNRLTSLQVGQMVMTKNHYEPVKDATNNQISKQEDPLFYSAPNLPPELQDMLASMGQKR